MVIFPAFSGLRARLIRTLILLLGAITAAVAIIWIIRVEPTIQSEIERRQQMLAQRAADQILHYIHDRLDRLTTVAEVGRFWEAPNERQRQALNRLMRLDPQISDVAFVDINGQQLIRTSRDRVYTQADLRSVANTDAFRGPASGKTYVSPVNYEFTAQPFVTIAVPVRYAGAEVAGVLMAELRLKSLWSTFANLSGATIGTVAVLDENGILIAHPDYSKVLQAAKMIGSSGQLGASNPEQKTLGTQGSPTITWRATVPEMGWTVVVEEPKETSLRELNTVKLAFFVLLGLAAAGALAVGCFYSNRITSAVHQLTQGAQSIASGNLEQRITIDTGDEIESLAGQFNLMADKLKASYAGLEEKVAARTRELSALYAALTPLVGAKSVSQRFDETIERVISVTGSDAAAIRLINPETKQLSYVAQRGFSAAYIADASPVLHEGGSSELALKVGKPMLSSDLASDPRAIRKRPVAFGYESCAYLPLIVRGEPLGIMLLASKAKGFFTEAKEEQLMTIARLIGIVVENHELFQAVVKSETELKRSNAELEQFAYVASHDLQEPLRMVTNYTTLLARRYKGKLDESANDYIGFAVDGAKRMQGLINDLLTYSRVGRHGKELAPLDCGEVFARALSALELAIADCGAKVTCDNLPTVLADEMQIGQLFQNLIGNAIKYRNGAAPEVHVECVPKGDDWQFAVRDNGIGIDPEYAERIFVIFQRLHTRDEYPGSGIGLAVCKKIVEHHGGKIWVESQVGKGATFYFTLPKTTVAANPRPSNVAEQLG